MGIGQIDGVSKLTEATQKMIAESETIGTKASQARELYTVWEAYRDRVAREVSYNGAIRDVEDFDKIAQEYMDDYLKISSKSERYSGKMFEFKGYRAKYKESILKYFEASKEYKKSLKHTARAVFRDPQGSNKLDDLFAEELNSAKNNFKFARRLKVGEFGLPAGLKVAKGVGIAGALGLLAWGAFKAYNYLYGTGPDPVSNYNPQETPETDIVTVADTVKDQTEQSVDTTAVMPVQEEVVEEPVVQETVVEQPVVQEEVVEEPVVQETVVEEPVVQEEVVEESVEEQAAEEKAPTQLPFILTFPVARKTISVEEDKYVPLSPFSYTMEYPTVEEPAKIEDVKPAEPPKEAAPKTQAKAVDSKTIAERRALFNEAIDKIKLTLSTEGIECDSYTVVKNDTLWKIAVTTLKNEGTENPTASEINQRIALLALLNEIDDVHKIYVNQALKVPSAELNAYLENNEEYCKILLELAELFA